MGNKITETDQKIFSKLIYEQGSRAQFLLLGDSNHFDTNVERLVMNKHALGAMRDAGIKSLMVEHMVFEQPAFDALAEGRITRNQFISILDSGINMYTGGFSTPEEIKANKKIKDDDIRHLADTILEAKRLGIKVYAVDGREGHYDRVVDNERNRRIFSSAVQMCESDPALIMHQTLYDDIRSDVATEMENDGSEAVLRYKPKRRGHPDRNPLDDMTEFEQRMELDKSDLPQRIFKLAKGEPAAIFYGNWHIGKAHDLDEALEELQSQSPLPATRRATNVINIYKEPDGAAKTMREDLCGQFNCAVQPNHLNFYYTSGKLDTGNIGYSQKPTTVPGVGGATP